MTARYQLEHFAHGYLIYDTWDRMWRGGAGDWKIDPPITQPMTEEEADSMLKDLTLSDCCGEEVNEQGFCVRCREHA